MNDFSETVYPNIRNHERDIIKKALEMRMKTRESSHWQNSYDLVLHELTFKRVFFDRSTAAFTTGCLRDLLKYYEHAENPSGKVVKDSIWSLIHRLEYFTKDNSDVFDEDFDM